MKFLRSKPFRSGSDSELLAVYKRTADPAVIDALFDRYSHLVLAVCMKYLKDEDDSKDAVMHIFGRLQQSLLRYEVKDFSHWLYAITRNHCLKELKRRQGTAPLDEWPAESEPEPSSPEITPAQLAEALGHLGPGQRECVRLFYLEEKTYKEIMETTGFTYNEVKSHIQNGKRNLRIYLEKNGNPG